MYESRLTNYQLARLVNYRLCEHGLPEVTPQQIYSARRGQPDLTMADAPEWIERYVEMRSGKVRPKVSEFDFKLPEPEVEIINSEARREVVLGEYITQMDLSKGFDLLDFIFPDGCDEEWIDAMVKLMDHIGMTPDMVAKFDYARRGWLSGAGPAEWHKANGRKANGKAKKGKKGKGKKS